MLSTVEQILFSYNTSFLQKSLEVQFEILLYGLNPKNSDFLHVAHHSNSTLFDENTLI